MCILKTYLWFNSAKFGVLTAAKMSMLVFYVVTPCRLVGKINVYEEHTASIFSFYYPFRRRAVRFLTYVTHTQRVIHWMLLAWSLQCSGLCSNGFAYPGRWFSDRHWIVVDTPHNFTGKSASRVMVGEQGRRSITPIHHPMSAQSSCSQRPMFFR
jgi:hypothetical protein